MTALALTPADRRWLDLCDQAERAALRIVPNRAADDLAVAAGRLTMTAGPGDINDQVLVTSFRWDCTAYGRALPDRRAHLAAGLVAKAALVRALIDPATPMPSLPVEGAGCEPMAGDVAEGREPRRDVYG